MDLDDFKRFGGDEFAVLFEDLEKVDHAINVAQRVERGLIAPFEMVGHEVVVTISIGIVSAARGEFRVRTGPRCGRAPAQWSAWRPW